MRIIHLSDLHIGKSNNTEKVERIVAWIRDHPEVHRSRVVAVTGDLTDDGASWQFQRVANLLEPLADGGYRVFPVPGNHDYGPYGITERKQSVIEFQQYLGTDQEYPYLEVVESTAFVLLDSMQGEIDSIEFFGAEGQVGRKQRRKLDKLLDGLEEDPKITRVVLLLHHHPFDYKKFHQLRDAKKFLKVLRSRGRSRVTALLFGHKHLDTRFNHPRDNKEQRYGIDLIYASGSTVERNLNGEMVIPVIDLKAMIIERYGVK